MSFFTSERKKNFCVDLLKRVSSKIIFLDIGSEGILKYPWHLIPTRFMEKIDFDPLKREGQALLCLSDRSGERNLFVARAERASSLHPPSETFIRKFGMDFLRTKKTIKVTCQTLDDILQSRCQELDIVDISVEGHDFQVLQGGQKTISNGNLKLIKANFELTEMWHGQGWFSDIDTFLRSKDHELSNIEIVYKRPASLKKVVHRGHPIAGRAYYTPSLSRWDKMIRENNDGDAHDNIVKAIVLYVINDMPGTAFDLLDFIDRLGNDVLNTQIFRGKILNVFRYAIFDRAREELSKMGKYVLSFLGSSHK